jgi:hypothetical protein
MFRENEYGDERQKSETTMKTDLTRNVTNNNLSGFAQTQKTNISNIAGLVRTNSFLTKNRTVNGIVQNSKPKPVLLSRTGLPVLPVK